MYEMCVCASTVMYEMCECTSTVIYEMCVCGVHVCVLPNKVCSTCCVVCICFLSCCVHERVKGREK